MTTDMILQCVIAILTGLATAIPLVVELIRYVQKAVKEKNWDRLVDLVIELMERAETMFPDGPTRKQWVMAMVQTSSEYINFDVDMDVISELIDSLCSMSKVVNGPEIQPETESTNPPDSGKEA